MSKKNRETDRSARAAAAMAEQERQERRRRNLMIGGVVGAILLIVVAGFFVSRSLDTTNDVDSDAPSRQRVRRHHRPGRRAPQGRHLRGLPLPLLR